MTMLLKSDFRPGNWIRSISADWLNTVAKRLNNITMQNGEVDITEDEIILYPGVYGGDGGTQYQQPFDISDLTDDSFSISSELSEHAIWYRGKRITTITAGAGLTFTTDHWSPTSAISATQYVWLEVDNSNAGETTIIMGTDMQSDPEDPRYDYIEVMPLWKFTVDAGVITEVADLRGAFRLSAMA